MARSERFHVNDTTSGEAILLLSFLSPFKMGMTFKGKILLVKGRIFFLQE